MARRIMSSLFILLCSCGGDPANREPTEEEMLGVVQAALDDYNYGLEATEKACRDGHHRNDPVLGMQCPVLGLTLPPSLAAIMGNGEVVQKRFVWTGENWLAL